MRALQDLKLLKELVKTQLAKHDIELVSFLGTFDGRFLYVESEALLPTSILKETKYMADTSMNSRNDYMGVAADVLIDGVLIELEEKDA